MNSNSESLRVEEIRAAISADPNYEYRKDGDRQVLVRKAAGTGNTLDHQVRYRPGQPTSLVFSKEAEHYRVEIPISASSGKPQATSITITPPEGQETLDPVAYGHLNPRGLLTEMTEQIQSPFLRHLLQRSGESGRQDPFIEIPKPGRKGRPSIEYAIWADRYVEANHRSNGKPIALLVDEHPGHSKDSLRAILHKARKRGLLSDSRSGRAGGHLLPKATELLSRHGLSITSKEN